MNYYFYEDFAVIHRKWLVFPDIWLFSFLGVMSFWIVFYICAYVLGLDGMAVMEGLNVFLDRSRSERLIPTMVRAISIFREVSSW